MTCPRDRIPTIPIRRVDTLTVNRYLLEKRIGIGPLGDVYLAQDQRISSRTVVVRLMDLGGHTGDGTWEQDRRAFFEREAVGMASIQHPNVVQTIDYGVAAKSGFLYLVSEYVEGQTLHDVLHREKTLKVDRVVVILRQLAEGLKAGHEIGMRHLGLKPSSIFLLDNRGKSRDFVKINGFGLTGLALKILDSYSFFGTQEFMAPEQFLSDRRVDLRADIYALGTIGYLMLGGKTPFTGDLMEIVTRKTLENAPPLSVFRPDIPIELEKTIMSALERNPADRPPAFPIGSPD